jgi:hypothetical protein
MSNRTTRDPTCPAGAVTTIFIHLAYHAGQRDRASPAHPLFRH